MIILTRVFSMIVLSLAVLGNGFTAALAAPRYLDSPSQELVEDMIQAHGGYDAWLDAPSAEIHIAMYLLLSIPDQSDRTPKDNWRHYKVMVEPSTSKALVDVPWEHSVGYEVGLTRERYWAKPLSYDPPFQEPAFMLGWYHYAMINLPFMTQVIGSVLQSIEDIEHPHTGKQLRGVYLTFEDSIPRQRNGGIKLYIDPDTNLLAAWRHETMYPELPGDVLPPVVPAQNATPLRVAEQYGNYDGFILPEIYTSLGTDDNVLGVHSILSASFSKPFPHAALAVPEDAKVLYQRDTNEPSP